MGFRPEIFGRQPAILIISQIDTTYVAAEAAHKHGDRNEGGHHDIEVAHLGTPGPEVLSANVFHVSPPGVWVLCEAGVPEGRGQCRYTWPSIPFSDIGCDAMLSAEPSQAGDGSPYLATIAPDTEQVLANDASVDAHDLGNLLLRLTVDEIEEQGLTLTMCQRGGDQLHNRPKKPPGSGLTASLQTTLLNRIKPER
mgnify:FL=1